MNLARKALMRALSLLRDTRLLLVAVVLSAPASFIGSLALLYAAGQRDSWRAVAAATLVGLLLLLLPAAWVLNMLLRRKLLRLVISHWPYYVLAGILLLGAGYQIWTLFAPAGFNQPHLAFEVEILSRPNAVGDICLQQIRTGRGELIRAGSATVDSFSLSGSWSQGTGACRYFSEGSKPGGLAFRYRGQINEVLSLRFAQSQGAGSVVIRVQGQEVAGTHLAADAGQDFIVSVAMAPQALLLWNIIGVLSWSATLLDLVLLSLAVWAYADREGLVSRGRIWTKTSIGHLQDLLTPDRIGGTLAVIERWAANPATYLVIAALLLSWPIRKGSSSDEAYYLSLAKNIYFGNGYVNTDLSAAIYRGPVFPLLISLSYAILGVSLRSALALERLAWLLTIFASYLLGKQLFSRRTGLLAGLFVLSAGVINQAYARVWTDGPLTTLILLAELGYWHTLRSQRGAKWYVLTGILFGLAYLLKSSALFIVPLPLLCWALFSDYRTSQNLGRLLLLYLIFGGFFFGWMIYVYLAGGSPGQILGDLRVVISLLRGLGQSITTFLTSGFAALGSTAANASGLSLLETFRTYYERDIGLYFKPPVLFPIALLYTAYQALGRKSRRDGFLLLGLLLFGTLIPVQVMYNFGPRINLYLYVIVLILIAAMLDRIVGALPRTVSPVLMLLAIVTVVWTETQNSPALQLLTPQLLRQPVQYNATYMPTAKWVMKNVPPRDTILMDLRDSEILHFLTNGNRHFGVLNTCVGELAFFPAQPCKPPYISFWVYKGATDPDTPRDALFAISEPSLLSTIQTRDVKYVIVTPRVYSLYFYLKVHPGFQEVIQLGDSVVFRVISPVRPLSAYPNVKWDTCIGQGTPEYLQNLRLQKPAAYDARIRDQITPWMGLSRQDLMRFENWQGCQFATVYPNTYELP